MDVIRQLPEHVANQIAAGEVILRPASAVKELLENALDAGADHIRVRLTYGGKQLIEVSDNGCGMSETDARMCFERHATSKITSIDDLNRIVSMGFRGEALASIAAVAHVTLRTRRPQDELGTLVVLEGSRVLQQEPAVVPPGTTMTVKNLFYNVPARRAFLKSEQIELRHVVEAVSRIALAHPDVQLQLEQQDVTLISVPKAPLRQRIVHLLGHAYNEKIVPVEETTNVVNIYGFIGKPDAARRTRGDQFFFVNRRFIRSPYLHRAVMTAYKDLLRPDTFPFYALFLEVDPARIDVNIHPTKEEVRFEDDKIIYAFVQAAVKHALARYTLMPTLDFSQETAFDRLPAFQHQPPVPQSSPQSQPATQVTLRRAKTWHWEQLHQVARNDVPLTVVVPSEAGGNEPQQALEDYSSAPVTPYQLHGRYILSPVKSGFVLIDQQAAHERILYERLLQHAEQSQPVRQQQLFPETLHVSPTHAAMLQQLIPELLPLGFDLEPFGNNTFLIRGLPPELGNLSGREALEQLLQEHQESGQKLRLRMREQLAASLSRRLAIKAGQTLSAQEMQQLIDQLFACQLPFLSPSGKRTVIRFDEEEIVRLFNGKAE